MNPSRPIHILTKSKLYFLLMGGCLVGFIWLGMSVEATSTSNSQSPIELCPIKRVTGYPCPSCGSTRSVRAIMQGDLVGAIYWNPLGLVIFMILIICPFWIAFDYCFKKETLFDFYKKIEQVFRNKWFAIFAILLILSNWIWNINKGL